MKKLMLTLLQITLFLSMALSAYAQDTGMVFKHLLLSDAFKRAHVEKMIVFVELDSILNGSPEAFISYS